MTDTELKPCRVKSCNSYTEGMSLNCCWPGVMDQCSIYWMERESALQERLKQAEERVSIYRNYLKKNGYGIQLHDIDKELALPKGE